MLFDLARMTTATTGTGTLTVGTAVSGYLTFAAAALAVGITLDGQTVSYAIVDNGGAAREAGTGVYTASGTTLTRNPIASTNSNAALNLSGSAEVLITGLASDFIEQLLAPEVVTSGSQATVTFNNIPQTFRDLIIRVRGRGTDAWNGVNVDLRVNNDSGSNYEYSGAFLTSTPGGYGSTGDTKMVFGVIPSAGSTANRSGGMTITIYNYKDTLLHKAIEFIQAYSIGSAATAHGGAAGGGNWLSTAAVTRVDVFLSSGAFVDGAVVSISGRH